MNITQLDTVDPNVAVIDTNVRRNAAADKDLVSSIKQHGILQPPVGWRDQDGIVHITMGQRRTLAARAAGLIEIPVIIQDQAEAETARIVAQLAENDHRDALPDRDRVQAFKQLAFDLGVSAAVIAKRTGTALAKVGTALTVAGSATAAETIDTLNLTLDEAALLVEFEDDPEKVEALMTMAVDDRGRLPHLASRFREERLDAEARQLLIDELAAAGIEYVEDWHWGTHTEGSNVWRKGDKKQKTLTEEETVAWPGVVGSLMKRYGVAENRGYSIRYGFVKAKLDELGLETYGETRTEPTPEQKEAESAERRRRKEVRAAFSAATEVRLAWIRDTFLPAKVKPAEVLEWLALTAVEAPETAVYAHDDKARALACEWLGIEVEEPRMSWQAPDGVPGLSARIRAAKGDDDRLRVMLAVAIARSETIATDGKRKDYGEVRDLAPYFRQLQAWGYTLSDVERAITEAA